MFYTCQRITKKKRESGPFNFSPLQYIWDLFNESLQKKIEESSKRVQKDEIRSFSFTWPYIVDPFSCTVYLFLMPFVGQVTAVFCPFSIPQYIRKQEGIINGSIIIQLKEKRPVILYFVTIHSQSKRRVMLVSD